MSDFLNKYNFTQEEWTTCLKVLAQLKEDPFNNPDNHQIAALVSTLYKKAKKTNRKQSYKEKKAIDLETINGSKISQNALKSTTSFDHLKEENTKYTTLKIPKNCYCCNISFHLAHSFYNRLCPSCAELNYQNRFKTIDLTNRNVILTGGRVKIGYATALKLLRCNANLTITTRLPALALEQFQQEEDYDIWKDNLTIYGLDLRNLKAVEDFVRFYKNNHDTLDILINNAAQTIKYTDQYYQPLIEKEHKLLSSFTDDTQLIANKTAITTSKELLQLEQHTEGYELNRFGQPVDNRDKNSWNSTLEEIDMAELLEVNLINQISPYYLIKEFTPLLKSSDFQQRFIINVTSSEGQFSYNNKSAFHPHTNMTKASLNMLTRTVGREYKQYGVYMNAVDVGWVSTGAKEELRKKQFEIGYIPPLDPVDGAARILVPIIEQLEEDKGHVGKLIKNYAVVDW